MANPIPADRAGVIPHLVCDRCADALEFYKSAFGAEELCRMPIPGADRILHAEIRIGDALTPHVPSDKVAQAIAKAGALSLDHEHAAPQQRHAMIRSLIERIDLRCGELLLTIDLQGLLSELGYPSSGANSEQDAASPLSIESPMSLRRRGVETRIVVGDRQSAERIPEKNLVTAIVSAHHDLAHLTDGSGRSLRTMTTVNDVDRSDLARSLRLAFLSPRIVDSILTGTQPVELTARRLSRLADLPLSWSQQERLLGLEAQ